MAAAGVHAMRQQAHQPYRASSEDTRQKIDRISSGPCVSTDNQIERHAVVEVTVMKAVHMQLSMHATQ